MATAFEKSLGAALPKANSKAPGTPAAPAPSKAPGAPALPTPTPPTAPATPIDLENVVPNAPNVVPGTEENVSDLQKMLKNFGS